MKFKIFFSGFIYDTFGAIATANLLICALSGIAVAVSFDVNAPYDSISRFIIQNPWAGFFRNFHYWSGQLFLIFTIIHTIDHFSRKTEGRVKKGVWLRVTISVAVTFFVMLSGFILKGDADALQARRILDSLLRDVPLAGDFLASGLIGREGNFQLLYVHHIATATIFLFVVVYEHARYIWTKARTTLITILLVAILSYFFRAPLHDNINPVLKGPWYFVGFQEILHWMSHAGWSLLIILLVFVLFYFIPRLKNHAALNAKRILLVLFVAYSLLTFVGYFFRGENWRWDPSYIKEAYNPFKTSRVSFLLTPQNFKEIPSVRGRREACLVCHEDVQGFTASHSTEGLGCTSCHLGDPFTLDKNEAHKKMIASPGNLENASKTCGTADCHPDITDRIQKNIMTTNSGMVTVDRFVFNEEDDLSALAHVQQIGHSAADQHFRNLCAHCHLGNPKREFGEIDELSRGGGCNACHLNYSEDARNELTTYLTDETDTLLTNFHPEVSLKITDNHCLGCHSRSGRISTNYEGWHETLLESVDQGHETEKYRELQDGRIFRFVSDDVHHELGLECVDCHTSYELMGDGNLYAHKEQQQKVKCEDCHFEGKPQTVSYDELTSEEQKIVDLREHISRDKQFLITEDYRQALVNTWFENDTAIFIGKNTKKLFAMRPPAEVCTRGEAHSDVTCSACHSAWAPQCVGCHNAYEEDAVNGFDLLEYEETKSAWEEYIGEYLADPPTLGVIENDSTREIIGFTPGMVLSIDVGSYPGIPEGSTIFKRLFAPLSPHTTAAKGRDCKSCHNSSLALGYGRGELEYRTAGNRGEWFFKPHYANNRFDGLPEDAWIDFMQERTDQAATRTDGRPFNRKEQEKILLVGSCLECHDQNSELMLSSLDDFQRLISSRSSQCILPNYYIE